MVRLPRRSEFLPGAPGLPPNRPYGPRSRRSDRMVTSARVRNSILANDSVAAAMLPAAARTRANAIAANAQRILMLERLHRRVPAVGHVRVRGARAIRHRRCAHAAGDGFVVGEGASAHAIPSAESEIVHGSGTGGGNQLRRGLRQRAQNHVGDALRRFDVARGHGGRRLSAYHQPARARSLRSGRITPAVYGMSSRTRQRNT